MREYKLYNRYGVDVRLREVEDGKWLYVIPEKEMEWIRYGTDPAKEDAIWMVDPSGGPYISIEADNTLYVYGDENIKAISFSPDKIEFERNDELSKSLIYIYFKDLKEICYPKKS